MREKKGSALVDERIHSEKCCHCKKGGKEIKDFIFISLQHHHSPTFSLSSSSSPLLPLNPVSAQPTGIRSSIENSQEGAWRFVCQCIVISWDELPRWASVRQLHVVVFRWAFKKCFCVCVCFLCASELLCITVSRQWSTRQHVYSLGMWHFLLWCHSDPAHLQVRVHKRAKVRENFAKPW